MTTLTIVIPDREAQEVSDYIKLKGGKVLAEINETVVKRVQRDSLKQGLTEALLITKGDIRAKPLAELWNE